MKRLTYIFIAAIAACLANGCAVEPDAVPNEDSKREFDAWISEHLPADATRTPLGAYISSIDNSNVQEGAKSVGDSDYIRVNYRTTNLKGQISAYNTGETAKQLGKFEKNGYYGPAVWAVTGNSLQVGVSEIVSGMREGERRTGVIPGWLTGSARYGSEAEYMAEVTGGTHTIYEIELVEVVEKNEDRDDMNVWQTVHMNDFINRHLDMPYEKPAPGFEGKFRKEMLDTAWSANQSSAYGSRYGFYMDNGAAVTKEDSVALAKDTTLQINYTGRRILPKYDDKGKPVFENGVQVFDIQIFDTTDEKLAKQAGIYTSGKTYGPVKVTWAESESEVKLGGNSTISGFSKLLWNMQYKHKLWDDKEEYRKGVGIFYSPYGYGYSGSGKKIPGYSPLMFEIEIIKEEKE